MSRLDCILVYEWQAWKGFLISHLVADYCHVQAAYEDDFSALERWLTPNIRAVLPQVNLSHSRLFPQQRAALFQQLKQRNILLLNAEVEDISKRHLHAMLARAGLRSARALPEGAPQQRLFVKSNLNWGGAAEQRLPPALQAQFALPASGLIQNWDGYYTALREEIAPALWRQSDLVIENYIENADNSFFRVYGFGEALVVVKAHSNALIKKLSGHPADKNYLLERRQLLEGTSELDADLHNQIKGFVRACPLAYFCLDMVHDGTQHTIIDLNLTPWAGVKQQTTEAVDFLCHGAQEHIKRSSLRNGA